jgi:hypothetical protein
MEYLIFAYQDECPDNIYYLDTEYGEVRLVNQSLADLKDLTNELEIHHDKFLYIPKQSKEVLVEDLKAFIETITDPKLKSILAVGLESPQQLQAFKVILGNEKNQLEKFLKNLAGKRVADWLAANALGLIEPSSS